jgi:hypothetical protein
MEKKPVVIGIEDFSEIADHGSIYVDKTEKIYQLLTGEASRFFLARPRRFGKTLLLSTIENVLLGKKSLFEKFAICQNHPEYKWDSCHVIRLDMNNYDPFMGFDSFDHSIYLDIKEQAESYGIKLEAKTAPAALSGLIKHLYISDKTIPFPRENPVRFPTIPKVAILIDEYDFPLAYYFNDLDNLQIMRRYFYGFYNVIKSRFRFIRFLFVTGVTRFNLISPLSGISSLVNLTFDTNYSEICGFTKDEIFKYFDNQMQTAHKKRINEGQMHLTSTVSDLYKQLMDWYDGYSFDGISHVLNPESVLLFLANNSFEKYWYNNSGPTILEYLKLQNADYFKYFAKNVTFKVTINHNDIMNLTPEASLLQTGFLTIDKIIPNIDDFKNSQTSDEAANSQTLDGAENSQKSDGSEKFQTSDRSEKFQTSDRSENFQTSDGTENSQTSDDSENSQLSNVLDNKTYLLTIPNEEVNISFANDFLLKKLYGPLNKPVIADIEHLYNNFAIAFTNREVKLASGLLSSIYDSIPYLLHDDTESFYSSHLIPPLSYADGHIIAEKNSGEGRVDMVLNMREGEVYVIELKFHRSPFRSKDELERIQTATGSSADSTISMVNDHVSSQVFLNIPSETIMISETKTQTKDKKNMSFINHLLDTGINQAFHQIFTKRYALEFLGRGKKVYAVAISIVSRTFVRIEMQPVKIILGIDNITIQQMQNNQRNE